MEERQKIVIEAIDAHVSRAKRGENLAYFFENVDVDVEVTGRTIHRLEITWNEPETEEDG